MSVETAPVSNGNYDDIKKQADAEVAEQGKAMRDANPEAVATAHAKADELLNELETLDLSNPDTALEYLDKVSLEVADTLLVEPEYKQKALQYVYQKFTEKGYEPLQDSALETFESDTAAMTDKNEATRAAISAILHDLNRTGSMNTKYVGHIRHWLYEKFSQ